MIWVSLQREDEKKTIVFIADSSQDLERIRHVLKEVMSTDERIQLGDIKDFALDGLNGLTMERDERIGAFDRSVSVIEKNEHPPGFRWARSAEAWQHALELVDSLISSGGPGHQFLTDNSVDAAEVRVSLGEEFP